jgi:hypothetical protein
MSKRLTVPVAIRDLLEVAGYVWHPDDGLRDHQTPRRQIMAEIAAALSPEQVTRWIAQRASRP